MAEGPTLGFTSPAASAEIASGGAGQGNWDPCSWISLPKPSVIITSSKLIQVSARRAMNPVQNQLYQTAQLQPKPLQQHQRQQDAQLKKGSP